ncbi:thioredoxin domain-containing protein [Pseudodesulfovibrio sp. JC047]|nr:thioredoxin domain-containing protein [Pseudodesulfovibrio sp. JC047]
MKQEFDIEDIWIPHELHPETPAQGVPTIDRFSQFDIDQAVLTCNQRGEPYGLTFGDMTVLRNSRLSLEAAEFAREHGVYHAFHHAVFRAYFTEGKDIGATDILLDVGESCGLDRAALNTALADHQFAEKVAMGSQAARDAGVTALPTFIINDMPPMTGAISETRFRTALQSATDSGKS